MFGVSSTPDFLCYICDYKIVETKSSPKQQMKQFSSVFHSWYRKALKHTKYRWFIIFGTLFYLVSPLDISPDTLPIIGWIDDGIIASLLISEVSQLITEGLKKRQLFNDTIKTELETVIDTDNVKTITVDAVTVS